VSSNQDFGVEQFFRADEFRAVDPSPKKRVNTLPHFVVVIKTIQNEFKLLKSH
jgi:hypothetical protein